MIVGVIVAVLADTASENCVSKGISLGFNLPASVKENMVTLCRLDCIKHN